MSDSGLRTVAGLGILMVAVFHSLDEVLAPNLALSSGQDGFGLAGFLALSALSALAGAVLYAIWGVRFAPRRVFLTGIACSAVGFALLALLPTIWGFRIAPLWIGLGVGPLWPILLTAIQLRVALERRGAVIGALSAVVLLAQPASALLAAPCVVWLGPQGLTNGLAVVLGCVALAAPWLPGLRSMLSETPANLKENEHFSGFPMVSSQEKTE
jgi:MFS family permease